MGLPFAVEDDCKKYRVRAFNTSCGLTMECVLKADDEVDAREQGEMAVECLLRDMARMDERIPPLTGPDSGSWVFECELVVE